MEKDPVSQFYDAYVEDQVRTGINDRIYGVYQRMLHLGLEKHSVVLELGCGIGLMTKLLGNTVRKGRIEGIDISGASVEYAKQHFGNARVVFKTQDVVQFETDLIEPDFITLIDVLEHIPLAQHAALFQRIGSVMGRNSTFVINLPNPDYIAHDIALEADSLQVIDQPVPLAAMMQQLKEAQLELMVYEKYGIWHHDEYQWFVLRLKRPFKEETIDTSLSIYQKIQRKIKRFRIKLLNK